MYTSCLHTCAVSAHVCAVCLCASCTHVYELCTHVCCVLLCTVRTHVYELFAHVCCVCLCVHTCRCAVCTCVHMCVLCLCMLTLGCVWPLCRVFWPRMSPCGREPGSALLSSPCWCQTHTMPGWGGPVRSVGTEGPGWSSESRWRRHWPWSKVVHVTPSCSSPDLVSHEHPPTVGGCGRRRGSPVGCAWSVGGERDMPRLIRCTAGQGPSPSAPRGHSRLVSRGARSGSCGK